MGLPVHSFLGPFVVKREEVEATGKLASTSRAPAGTECLDIPACGILMHSSLAVTAGSLPREEALGENGGRQPIFA